jgi:hypothetical protein
MTEKAVFSYIMKSYVTHLTYEVVSENSWTVIVVTASIKDDEGEAKVSLPRDTALRTHMFLHKCFSTKCFVLSALDGKIEQRVCIKFWRTFFNPASAL